MTCVLGPIFSLLFRTDPSRDYLHFRVVSTIYSLFWVHVSAFKLFILKTNLLSSASLSSSWCIFLFLCSHTIGEMDPVAVSLTYFLSLFSALQLAFDPSSPLRYSFWDHQQSLLKPLNNFQSFLKTTAFETTDVGSLRKIFFTFIIQDPPASPYQPLMLFPGVLWHFSSLPYLSMWVCGL